MSLLDRVRSEIKIIPLFILQKTMACTEHCDLIFIFWAVLIVVTPTTEPLPQNVMTMSQQKQSTFADVA